MAIGFVRGSIRLMNHQDILHTRFAHLLMNGESRKIFCLTKPLNPGISLSHEIRYTQVLDQPNERIEARVMDEVPDSITHDSDAHPQHYGRSLLFDVALARTALRRSDRK